MRLTGTRLPYHLQKQKALKLDGPHRSHGASVYDGSMVVPVSNTHHVVVTMAATSGPGYMLLTNKPLHEAVAALAAGGAKGTLAAAAAAQAAAEVSTPVEDFKNMTMDELSTRTNVPMLQLAALHEQGFDSVQVFADAAGLGLLQAALVESRMGFGHQTKLLAFFKG